MKGVCIHHDAGALGSAVPKEVWLYRLKQLKSLGCNAIRMSHNPESNELFEACDELGFVVMAEAFDESVKLIILHRHCEPLAAKQSILF